MRRRELVRSVLLGLAVFLAIGIYHNLGDIITTTQRLATVRGPEGVSGISVWPFVWRAIKYIAFYMIAGAVTGGIVALVAHLLVQPGPTRETVDSGQTAAEDDANAPGDDRTARKRFWRAYAILLGAFLVYVHLRMLTLHPGLFPNSHKWDWLAGDPLGVYAVLLAGRIVPILIALLLLRRYAGEIGRFLRRRWMIVAPVTFLVLIAVGGWWGAEHLGKQPPLTNTGPNVIIIALDSVRPDHISWKGLRKPYWRETTPNIDRFLPDAVWFEQAYVPLARTYPSWISILTGCWPPTHGVRFDLPPPGHVLPRVPTFAQQLQKAGYKTAFFLDNTNFAWTDPALGFDTIVEPSHNIIDFYISSVQPPSVLYYYFLNNRLGYLYEPGLRMNAGYRAVYRPEVMNREIVRHIRRMRGEPKFFMGIHLCTIHVPFCLSYPYSLLHPPKFGRVINRFGYGGIADEIQEKKDRNVDFTDEERWRIYTQEVALYDALVRSADDCFGEILRAIQDAGLYENSYILFMSDHGENLPEEGLRYLYGSSTHGFFLWGDGDTHVPLAIKFPKQQYAGRRVERLVRSIDIAPTLLDDLALAPLEKAEGVSRMSDVRGGSDDRQRWVYAETGTSNPKMFIRRHLDYEFAKSYQVHEVDPETLRIYKKKRYYPNLITAKDRMIRTERWKIIAYPVVTDGLTHKVELFDLTNDVNSVHDVGTSHPTVRSELFGRILPFIQRDLEEFGSGKVHALTDLDKQRIVKDGL